MACLEMYNSDHHHNRQAPPPLVSPRISFSNDFAESSHHQYHHHHRQGPVSSDFEFSVTNYSMMSADELFCKGKLLPYKNNNSINNNNNNKNGGQQRTLREELLVEDKEEKVSFRVPKSASSTRWKGFLGLRRSHIGSRKPEATSNSQEILNDGGTESNCTDMEIGI